MRRCPYCGEAVQENCITCPKCFKQRGRPTAGYREVSGSQNMPTRVSYEEIARAIYSARCEYFASKLAEGLTSAPYDRRRFEEDMLSSGLLADPSTIRAKWRLLLSRRTVIETYRNGTPVSVISIPAFYILMSPSARTLCDAAQRERDREIEIDTTEVEA